MYNYIETINKLSFFLETYKINITEDNLLDLLKVTNRWPYQFPNNCPSIEVITEWENKDREDIYDLLGKFNYQKWKEKYDNGFTSILSDILDLTEELRILQSELYKIFGKNLFANFYFSKGSDKHRVSFNHHSHDYDVIVKIIYGNCKWKINEEYFDFKSGDVIYVPAGTRHSVVECLDKKLSMTINLH